MLVIFGEDDHENTNELKNTLVFIPNSDFERSSVEFFFEGPGGFRELREALHSLRTIHDLQADVFDMFGLDAKICFWEVCCRFSRVFEGPCKSL